MNPDAADPRTRIMGAARALTRSNQDTTFTIQQVVERAEVALRTFYRYFASKDELILDLLVETLEDTTRRIARAAIVEADEPIGRLKIVVTYPFLGDDPEIGPQVIVREHLRLLGEYPLRIEAGIASYRQLIAGTIREAQQRGDFPVAQAERDAKLIHWMVMTQYFYKALGLSDEEDRLSAEALWEFCLGALMRSTRSE